MTQPEIELYQFFVVVLFLGGLLALRFFLTRNASGIRANLTRDRRILMRESQGLQGGAILSLVEIDGRPLAVLHGKNQTAAFHELQEPALAMETGDAV